jgi:hypothetical protein
VSTDAAAPGSLTRADGVAWLVLDDPGRKVNTLSSRLMGWLEEQVETLARQRQRQQPDGLVILSGKSDGFVAGADIEELQAASDRAAVLALPPAATRSWRAWRASPSPPSPRSTAPAWAAGSSWRSPAAAGWRPSTRRPGSACRRSSSG